MKSIINYFVSRPLIANALLFGVIISSIIFWPRMGKEEMPDFAMNSVSISIRYPGASAEDVELFITKPIEESLKSVSYIKNIATVSSYGSSSFRITFEPKVENLSEKIQEVKDSVNATTLPRESEQPIYRQFKSSEKAIIDVGLYLKDVEILDVNSRQKLQKIALSLQSQLLSLDSVSAVDPTGYLIPELQIQVFPTELLNNEISLNQIRSQIISQHVRRPLGNLKDKVESEITILSELNSTQTLNDVVVSAGFQGQKLKLSKLATIEDNFERATSIIKIQGREGIILGVTKSSITDILTAQKQIVELTNRLQETLKDSGVGIILMDDESYNVSNRLSLIGTNGLLGFALITLILFLFLDFKTGLWVAMGIPFALAFTLLCSMLMGYTINNMTLAAIIIVIGIVVDDAIIVAENIVRRRKEDGPAFEISKAVLDVGGPVVASILTTCAAFIPLYFFSGRFGLFVKFIPAIIFLMLFASLIESFTILPSHLATKEKPSSSNWMNNISNFRNKVTEGLEQWYEKILLTVLNFKGLVLLSFAGLLVFSGYIYQNKLKYVMFPNEESNELRLRVIAPEGTKRFDTAKMISKVEDIFLKDPNNVVLSVYSRISQSRRATEVKENEASVFVEIVPPSERKLSLAELKSIWEEQAKKLTEFEEIKFQTARFGSDSGSPIVIEIQENDDELRAMVAEKVKKELETLNALTNIEIEKPVTKNEYKLQINRDEANRLGVSFDQIATTLRTYLEGDILYILNNSEEEVNVRLTTPDKNKESIKNLLSLTIANQNNYLIPISQLVTVIPTTKPANITRYDFKRTVSVFADLDKNTKMTPLEVSDRFETSLFSKILAGNSSTVIRFGGEVQDSKEAMSDFFLSILLALIIIYILLIILFDSLTTPLLIFSIIPFGVVGSILAFYLHGKMHYGFFAVIGTIGMIGVVINDAIVLIDKLEKSILKKIDLIKQIASVSATRLRAIILTTVTTVAGLLPTAYGVGGFDSMLAEMMLAMGWGLLFGMLITLVLIPCLYFYYAELKFKFNPPREL